MKSVTRFDCLKIQLSKKKKKGFTGKAFPGSPLDKTVLPLQRGASFRA